MLDSIYTAIRRDYTGYKCDFESVFGKGCAVIRDRKI